MGAESEDKKPTNIGSMNGMWAVLLKIALGLQVPLMGLGVWVVTTLVEVEHTQQKIVLPSLSTVKTWGPDAAYAKHLEMELNWKREIHDTRERIELKLENIKLDLQSLRLLILRHGIVTNRVD